MNRDKTLIVHALTISIDNSNTIINVA